MKQFASIKFFAKSLFRISIFLKYIFVFLVIFQSFYLFLSNLFGFLTFWQCLFISSIIAILMVNFKTQTNKHSFQWHHSKCLWGKLFLCWLCIRQAEDIVTSHFPCVWFFSSLEKPSSESSFSAIVTFDVLTVKASEIFVCSSLNLNRLAVKWTFLIIATMTSFDDVPWRQKYICFIIFHASFLMCAVNLNSHVETL